MIPAGHCSRLVVDLSEEELSDIVNVLELRVLDLMGKAERMPDAGRRRQWNESAERLSRLAGRLLDTARLEP